MNPARLGTVTWGLVTALLINGCCGGEQHAINISAPQKLTVTMGGTTFRMYSATQITTPPLDPSGLQFIFNTLEGAAGGEGVAFTMRGDDSLASSQTIMLSLALPVALRDGDIYTVGNTFSVEPGATDDPRAFGQYDLAQPSQAEVAFTESTYTFPPAQFAVNFRAKTSTGTIAVTHRQRGQVELQLDLSFTDGSGTTASVSGRVEVVNQSFAASCS